MKRLVATVIVLAVGMVLTTVAQADDMADVKAAVLEHYAAINAGDMDAAVQQHTPEFSGFLADGGLLWGFDSLEDQRKTFQAFSGAGFKTDWQVVRRHLDVEIYGETAIATFYLVGTITWPGGFTRQGTWRVSEVWIKQGGQWKEAHHHDSPLIPAPLPGREPPLG
ncbi:nuclear transport factor 2 family protein [Acidobacteria bacterium AH-259-L09]|nr:nuclear transport factor 2 family protein [Acidobacteria bacterium AH-259-L09]